MSKWSDGAEILQKLITAKEVIPIQGDLINLQQTMFALQTEQMKLIDENSRLKAENDKLKKKKSYVYPEGHSYLIDPERPDLRFCPVCLNRDGFENPGVKYGAGIHCSTCKKAFD